MKVLHIIPSISPLRGGTSTAALDMCSALSKSGVDVLLLTTNDDGRSISSVPTNVLRAVDGYHQLYFPRQTRLYSTAPALLRWLRLNGASYDLLHVHALFSHVSDWSPMISRSLGVPYGITTHGILGAWGLHHRRRAVKQWFIKLIVLTNLQHASFVHFTSALERQESCHYCASCNAVVFPLGVSFGDCPVEVRTFSENRTLRLLHLSRIDRKKGLELLLEALSLHPELAGIELSIAGKGDPNYMQELKTLCMKLGISKQVAWLGFVSGAKKQQAFTDADVFVSPSYSENFGIAPIEAMAAGLPVLISDQMGISERVASAGAGIVVEPDSRQIADALHRLNSNRQLLPVLGARARKLALEEYSLDKMEHNLIGLYANAIGSGSNLNKSAVAARYE